MTQETTDKRMRSLDRRWIAALAILGLGVIAFATAIAVDVLFDPQDDDLEPADSITTALAVAGMVFPLLSGIPVGRIGWWIFPYFVAAYALGCAAAMVLAFAVLMVAELATFVW
jgi:hypothetical protein